MRIYIYLIIFYYPFNCYSQLSAEFTTSTPNTCIEENIELINTSTGQVNQEWDFCLGDFTGSPIVSDHSNVSGLGSSWGLKIIEDNNSYFGFVTDRNNSKIFRLEFGTDLTSVPQVFDLGNPGGLLSFPEGLDIVKQNDNWFGFVGYLNNGGNITRLDFGNSLSNTPTGTNLGNFGIGTVRIRNLQVVNQNGDYILVLVVYNTGSIVCVNYRDSFDNAIGAGDKVTHSIIGSSLPTGISITKHMDRFKVHLVSWLNNAMQQINFGDDLMQPPTVEWSQTFSGIIKPHRIKVFREGNNFFGLVTNENLEMSIIDLKDLEPVNQPTEITMPGLIKVNAIDGIKYQGRHWVYGVKNNNPQLQKIEFVKNCPWTEFLLTDPESISYTEYGDNEIELQIWDAQANTDYFVEKIIVSDQIAGTIDFEVSGSCLNETVQFSEQSNETIANVIWNFGDGTTEADQNPEHSYSSTGIYNVRITATFISGCQNYISKQIEIFEPPVSDFQFNPITLCTHQQITFTNQTTGPPSSVTSFQWNFNDEGESSETHPVFSFAEPGTKIITLTASIPGCETQVQKVIQVLEGPVIDFEVENICIGESLNLINNSSGDTTGYEWDFGDGYTSTLVSPFHEYAQPGTYQVSLTGFSSLGCETTVSKQVHVSEYPIALFSYDLPCAGQLVLFFDESTVSNDNIVSWEWNFGDNTEVTTLQSPEHTFATDGEYLISLSVTSSNGCISTKSEKIEVLPVVIPSFEVVNNCYGNLVRFIPKAIINDNLQIVDTTWLINGLYVDDPMPELPIGVAGTYSATLFYKLLNGCTIAHSNNFEITDYPIADFELPTPCIGELLVIEDRSDFQPNVPAIHKWLMNGIFFSSEINPNYTFNSPGDYDVELQLNINGCISSVKKFVHVEEKSVADFQLDFPVGGAPLRLSVENMSKNSTSYKWLFNQQESVEFEPDIVLENLGLQNIVLIATNATGCSDSTEKEVQVLPPYVEILLDNIILDNLDGRIKIVLKIINNGSIPLKDGIAEIELGEGVKFSETIQSIAPLSEKLIVLNPEINPEDLSKISYLCVRIYSDDITQNQIPVTDKFCLNLLDKPIFATPKPNPFHDYLNISTILKTETEVGIRIINSLGRTVFREEGLPGKSGENFFVINPILEPGVYLLTISADNFNEVFRIVFK
jgi:PKD repeat protein